MASSVQWHQCIVAATKADGTTAVSVAAPSNVDNSGYVYFLIDNVPRECSLSQLDLMFVALTSVAPTVTIGIFEGFAAGAPSYPVVDPALSAASKTVTVCPVGTTAGCLFELNVRAGVSSVTVAGTKDGTRKLYIGVKTNSATVDTIGLVRLHVVK